MSAQSLVTSVRAAFEMEKGALTEQNQRMVSQILALEQQVIALEKEKQEACETIRVREEKHVRDVEAWLVTTKEKELSRTAMSAEVSSVRDDLAFCRRQLTVSEEQLETTRRCWSAEKTALEAGAAASTKTIAALRRQQEEGLDRQRELERQMATATQDNERLRETMREISEKQKGRETERDKERQLIMRDWEEKYRVVTGKLEVSTRQGQEWEYRLRAAEAEATEALRQVDAVNGALINAQVTLASTETALASTQDTLTSAQDTLKTTQQQVTALQQALETSQVHEDQALNNCRKTHERELEVMRGRMSEADEERQEMSRRLVLSTTASCELQAQVLLLQSQLQQQKWQQQASETLLRARVDDLNDLNITIVAAKATSTPTSTASLATLRASLQASEIARLEAEHACEQSTSRLLTLEMESKVRVPCARYMI